MLNVLRQTSRNSLYDTYKMAIRWASDRIDKQGVVAFVTNGSWIDGNVDSGIRACLAEEFSAVHVLHLRGNQRTQGERSRREGGKIFGSGSRAPVAITILVKNPNATHDGCKIQYRDIGDYLTREAETGGTDRSSIHKRIQRLASNYTPNTDHDWVDQRSDAFAEFYPHGFTNDARAGRADDAIFRLVFKRVLATGRDAYIYNFSRNDLRRERPERMTARLSRQHLSDMEVNPELTEDTASRHVGTPRILRGIANLRESI